MKFGFDADTLEAVWIMYRSMFRINRVFFFFGLVFAGIFPIALYQFADLDINYLLFIPDVAYSLLGFIATFAAFTWTFRRNKYTSTLSKQFLIDLSMTKIDIARFLIGAVASESLIILYNLLPYSLGFFVTRFFLISSGAVGIVTPTDTLINFLWIFVYQISLYLWIYFLRILWIILQNTKLSTKWKILWYFSIISVFVILGQFRYIPISYFFGFYVNQLALWIQQITCVTGFEDYINLVMVNYHQELQKVLSDEIMYLPLSTMFTLLFLVNLYFIVMKYRNRQTPKQKYTRTMLFTGFVYLIVFQILSFISSVSEKIFYVITGMAFIINGIFFIFLRIIFSIIMHSASIISLSFPVTWIIGSSGGMYNYQQAPSNPMFLVYAVFQSVLMQSPDLTNLPIAPVALEVYFHGWASSNDSVIMPLILKLGAQLDAILGSIILCLILNRIVIYQFKSRGKLL